MKGSIMKLSRIFRMLDENRFSYPPSPALLRIVWFCFVTNNNCQNAKTKFWVFVLASAPALGYKK